MRGALWHGLVCGLAWPGPMAWPGLACAPPLSCRPPPALPARGDPLPTRPLAWSRLLPQVPPMYRMYRGPSICACAPPAVPTLLCPPPGALRGTHDDRGTCPSGSPASQMEPEAMRGGHEGVHEMEPEALPVREYWPVPRAHEHMAAQLEPENVKCHAWCSAIPLHWP